jgi:polar amino acid transport system substrate-binding protein
LSNTHRSVLGILLNLGLITGLAGFQVFFGLRPAAWAGSWDDIQKRGYLIIAVKDNWPPLGFVNQGKLQGFEIDMARQLAKEILGREDAVQLKPVANGDRLTAVTSGAVDLAIAGISVTTPRSRLVQFSSAYYSSGIALITKQPQIKQWANLTQQSVAVLENSTAVPVLKSELPGVKLVGVSSYQAALAQLESGQVAAFAGDVTVLSAWMKAYPHYRQLPGWLSANSFAIALPKGIQYDQLRQAVHATMLKWQKNGWLRKRAQFWGLPD